MGSDELKHRRDHRAGYGIVVRRIIDAEGGIDLRARHVAALTRQRLVPHCLAEPHPGVLLVERRAVADAQHQIGAARADLGVPVEIRVMEIAGRKLEAELNLGGQIVG